MYVSTVSTVVLIAAAAYALHYNLSGKHWYQNKLKHPKDDENHKNSLEGILINVDLKALENVEYVTR